MVIETPINKEDEDVVIDADIKIISNVDEDFVIEHVLVEPPIYHYH